MTLRIALVGGPMYDHLYTLLDDRDVEIVVHADHPTLNREVAKMLAAGTRIDVLSTHNKYAPSQRRWLRPLDGLIATNELAPKAVDLCSFDGAQLSIPRCIDVRVLWARRDRIAGVPTTWGELASSSVVFGFPGRESGLFGTFFEIVTSLRAQLFDDEAHPTMDHDAAIQAIEVLCALAQRAPSDLPDWHYDQVDAALLGGRVDAAAAWPGGFGPIRTSDHYDQLEPHPYVGGISYAGAHSWAIPTTCADVDGAIELISLLSSYEGSTLDASGGTVPAHVAAFDDVVPVDDTDAKRLAITRDTIANAMITYPPLTRFPEIEDAGWEAINAALRGELTPAQAVQATQAAAVAALG